MQIPLTRNKAESTDPWKYCRLISDSNNLLIVTTPAGDVIAQYTDLPGADQEGIAFDASGNMYIAQDSGGIVQIEWPDSY
jgi:hypothetical protein